MGCFQHSKNDNEPKGEDRISFHFMPDTNHGIQTITILYHDKTGLDKHVLCHIYFLVKE